MSFIKKHPVLVLFSVTMLLAIGFLILLEAFLAFTSSYKPNDLYGSGRYLAMREWEPNMEYAFTAPPVRASDGENIPNSYVVSVDDKGFIKPSFVHDQADKTIMFFGGSTTECLFVEEENRFPYVTGRLIESLTGLKIKSVNGARSGNHSMMSLLNLIGKGLNEKPDFVVLMHGVNDIGALRTEHGYWSDRAHFSVIKDNEIGIATAIRHIRDAIFPYTYRMIKKGMSVLAKLMNGKALASDVDGQMVEAGRFFESSLRSFVRVALAWNIQPVLMTQVVLKDGNKSQQNGAYLNQAVLNQQGLDLAKFKNIHDYFNAIVRKVAQEENVRLIDLAQARQWNNKDLYDNMHFTDLGSKNVADVIASQFVEYIN